jgi:hypothetical protein
VRLGVSFARHCLLQNYGKHLEFLRNKRIVQRNTT